MIRSEELRTGNWVWDNIGEANHQWRIYDYTLNTEFFSPIPLSSEILEKAGFKRGCLTKMLNDDWMIYYNDGMWLQVEKQGARAYVCERTDLFHIKYLHQLQNIYHALTNQELIINL